MTPQTQAVPFSPYVRKRDGKTLAPWDSEKIYRAIEKAFQATGVPYTHHTIDTLTYSVVSQLPAVTQDNTVYIEDIQDIVEETLIEKGYWRVARSYAIYRERRAALREGKDDLLDVIRDIDIEATRDNANVGNTMAGKVLQISEAASGYFYSKRIIPKEHVMAHDSGDFHIHDKAWYGKGLNCCQIPFDVLAKNGFDTGHGFIRPAKSCKTLAMHASIIIQANQNEQYGGQSYPDFDNQFVATGVLDKEREKIRKRIIKYNVKYSDPKNRDLLEELVEEELKDNLFQAMEALVYNLNTMHCLLSSEEIWVYDTVKDKLLQMPIGELASVFEPGRYQAISLNQTTGKAEMKYITGVSRKDNNRRIITIVDNEGRKVTTTDNHIIMCLNKDGNITGRVPEALDHVLSPRGINFPPGKSDIGLDHYHSRKAQKYLDDHVVITPEFAKVAGYYVADGSVVGGSQLCFTVCSTDKEAELISLMQQCYNGITYSRYFTPDGEPKDIRFNVGKVWADMFKDKFGSDAHTKRIPTEILFAGEDILTEFLNGYFKCDGSIKQQYIVATTVNKKLRNELNLILLRLGVLPHIAERSKTSGYGSNPSYEISINGLDIYARSDSRLKAATNVFPVTINRYIEGNSGEEYVYDLSVEDNETFLTAEGIFVHNSRGGGQIPFSSLNIGWVKSNDAAMVCEALLKAFDAGLGRGEQPIFPNVCFKIKDGVNMRKTDPYYYLFRLAQKVAARRLNPSWVFCDSSFNKGTDVAYMGCRTRVVANRHGESTVVGRGNIAFITENLPRLAIKARLKHPDDEEKRLSYFWQLHGEVLNQMVDSLIHRFEYICKTLKAKDFPFLLGQGLYRDAEKLSPEDSIYLAARHGTLTLGFIGLAECLTALIGEHHGQSERAWELGYSIIERIRSQADAASEKYDLNFSVIGTPAEGLSGRFTKLDRKLFGIIPEVTDKEYYTNSFHIPVTFKISSFDKIRIEGPFHKLCNGGHISYVEFSSPPPLYNLDVIEQIVLHMAACDMGYAAINYPTDYCRSCYTGDNIIPLGKPCPVCGEVERIDRVRRITGYLSTIDRFNDAKVAEERDRKAHI